LKADRSNMAALIGLADFYLGRRNFGQAMAKLNEAQQLNPSNAQVLARLGIVHSRMGRPDKALPQLEKATEQDPSLFEARAELGYLYFRAGDGEKGLQLVSDVLADEPRLAIALYYFGVMLFNTKGQPKQAEEAFKAALASDPNLAQASFSLAELYEQVGRTEEAKKAYDAAAKLGMDEARQALKKLGGGK
jgi:tetratricopeptide (TPR) repeat protein